METTNLEPGTRVRFKDTGIEGTVDSFDPDGRVAVFSTLNSRVRATEPENLEVIEDDDAGHLTTELLTVTALSLIPVTLIVIWVAKMAGMVAGV